MSAEPDEPALREALVGVMRQMQAGGLNRGTTGNASARLGNGMLVTPTGIPPDQLTPDSMVVVDEHGEPASGGLRPSTEYRMHHRLLRSRPDVSAVVHCHSRHATILACTGHAIEPLHYMVLVARSPRIPLAPFEVFGTEALADAAVSTMGSGYACLLANHGQITLGRNLAEALSIAEEVEEQAAITYAACLLGGGKLLDDGQLAATVARFKSYGQN